MSPPDSRHKVIAMTPEHNVTIPLDDLRTLLIGAATMFGIAEALGEDGLADLLTPEEKEIAAKAALKFIEEAYENL